MEPRILIDGRSGSGKTQFAAALAGAWPEAQLVRLDDLYPGWDGLDAGSMAVHAAATGVFTGYRWQSWDWEREQPAHWHELDPARPIIVEGCGALSMANKRMSTWAVWIELDEVTRKRRALLRDGDSYAPHWNRWAEQEERFIAREHPAAIADAIIDGADVLRDIAQWGRTFRGERTLAKSTDFPGGRGPKASQERSIQTS